MNDFLNNVYLGNSVQEYLYFAASLLISLLIIFIFRLIVLKRLSAWAKKSKTKYDDLFVLGLRRYIVPILYVAAIYANLSRLKLDLVVSRVVDVTAMAVGAALVATMVSTIVMFMFRRYWTSKYSDSNTSPAYNWIAGFVKVLIWGIAVILFLDNVGIKINSLIAGLGIGGVAIAFAAQAVLADVFCFFTIFFDRPFEIGDFIISGDQMGTVEHIGIKTTRLRSLTGEQLVFSNADLTSSRIRNFKTMQQRRVLFTLGVTYDTSLENMKQIPGLIKEIIESAGQTLFSRAHFFSYGASSLNFEIVYFVLTDNYDVYMDIHQAINLKIKEAFDARKIEFAFPTQTLHIHSTSASLLNLD